MKLPPFSPPVPIGQSNSVARADALIIIGVTGDLAMRMLQDIRFFVMNKEPGLDREGIVLTTLPLSLKSRDSATSKLRRRIAYERLLLDAIEGNPTLFVRRDEVERAWQWIDAIVDGWAKYESGPKPYAAGTWGPSNADLLIESSKRHWHI